MQVQVDPSKTYLSTNGETNPTFPATEFNLADIGAGTSSIIKLTLTGAYQAGNSPSFADVSGILLAVFIDGNGAYVGPPLNARSLPTGIGSFPTEVAQDFAMTAAGSLYVRVPEGAKKLLFSANDSFFSDNLDPNGDFKVDVSYVSNGSAPVSVIGTSGEDEFNLVTGSYNVNSMAGSGIDKLDYSNTTFGVSVTVGADSNVTAVKNLVGTDTVQNLGSGGIRVWGGSGDDYFSSLDADKTSNKMEGRWMEWEGGAGRDRIAGSSTEEDVIRFFSSPTGVSVNLERGWAADGFKTVDTFSGVEHAYGSRFDDTLMGDRGDNSLRGYGGNDILDGGSGTDEADYRSSTAGVTVSLQEGMASDGQEGLDTLFSIENVRGSDFVDSIAGDGNSNRLRGRAGDDSIRGGEGSDSVEGDAGNDLLMGEGGDDRILGGAGDDKIDGGAGNDTAVYSDAATGVTVNLATVAAQNTGGAGIDTITAVERLEGSSFNDTLTGNASANVLNGGLGTNLLQGAGGNDTYIHDGLGGNDVILDSQGGELLYLTGDLSGVAGITAFQSGGTRPNDLVFELKASDGSTRSITVQNHFEQSAANRLELFKLDAPEKGTGAVDQYSVSTSQTREGTASRDFIVGTAANDTTMKGNAGDDFMFGHLGADVMRGGDGADEINGGIGNDILAGDNGEDALNGGAGSDTLIGGVNTVVLQDGFRDAISYWDSPNGVVVNLNSVQETLSGVNSVSIAANKASDGWGATDSLYSIEKAFGSAHSDVMFGDASANVLIGEDGADRLVGGRGADWLEGGGGKDVFIYRSADDSATASGRDTIVGFVSGEDKIDLELIDAKTGFQPNDSFTYIGISQFAGVAGQLRMGAGILQGDINGDAAVDFEVSVAGVPSLNQADFVL